MTRIIRKIRPIHKPPRPLQPPLAEAKPKIRGPGLIFVAIIVLAAIPFSLGKYFEFNQPDPFDSGANVYSAAYILAGARIGEEEKPNANVGTLLVNIAGVWLFGFNEIGPKLIQGILQAAALILMFFAMRKLFGTLSAAVGVIIASVYLSAPLIAKFGNDKTQYTVAFMVMGISCFVLQQLGGKWWWAVLAGVFLSWAPLFKQIGVSAIGAIGLFVVLQPLLKNRTWKQVGFDILLLWAGAAAAIAPLYVWILVRHTQLPLPYSFVWQTLGKFLPFGAAATDAEVVSDYVSEHRKLIPFSQQWPIVLRYYGLLILPVAIAAGAIIARLLRVIWSAASPDKIKPKTCDRFVLLFAVWWVLDMAFVWISPASYEQYYLPLNASAAMLGGYIIAIYSDYLKSAVYKTRPVIIGVVGLLVMIAMCQHIFFGIEKSPYSGQNYGGRQRGYSQKFQEIRQRRKENLRGYWEFAADYIRTHSQPTDKIYVWGWYPGIYVMAQRFSAASAACSMPRPALPVLSQLVSQLLEEFGRQMPKFIVDSRKRHVPTDRPPYELWPVVRQEQGFNFPGAEKPHFVRPDEIEAYDKGWGQMLRTRFDEDEALRYEALKPLREFVMKNYRIIQLFGEHVLFELKTPTPDKEPQ